MMRTQPNIIITGTPGTGKSTHCEQLAEKTGMHHLSINDVVKKHNIGEASDDPEDPNLQIVDEDDRSENDEDDDDTESDIDDSKNRKKKTKTSPIEVYAVAEEPAKSLLARGEDVERAYLKRKAENVPGRLALSVSVSAAIQNRVFY
jgi:cytidylate kinase